MVLTDCEEIARNLACPTLVLAGPGAGKTYLLADRIKYLLDTGAEKGTITALAFGKDASQHMRDKLLDPKEKFRIQFEELPYISTMHSLGFQIVRERPHDVNLRKAHLQVQDEESVKQLMYRDAALLVGLSEKDGACARACKQRGDCKKSSSDTKCEICTRYWEIMSKCNHIDFDDQILFACQVLEKNPDILEKYQSRAKHLLVDEYQDINAAQFHLIQLLSQESRDGLFVVGDDAQSIYGFRGCDPEFILRFKEDFPGAETPPLAHSRRCHQGIMDDATKVLEKFYRRWSGKQKLVFHVPIGEAPQIWRLPSEVAEAEMVAKMARYFRNEKKTVLILAPKKEFFPLMIEKLCEHDVPHECPVSFLPERLRIANLFINWVRNPNNSFITRLAVEHLMNKGIARVPGAAKDRRSSVETIQERIKQETIIAELWSSVDRQNDLFSVIVNVAAPNSILLKIRCGLEKLLSSFREFKGDNRGEFAKQLAVVTGIWCDPSQLAEDVCSVVKLVDTQRPVGAGSVLLKTMRKAKGLEADIVLMIGLEDDIVPNPLNDIVEEARLFYVSMTRAREKLFLFHSYKRPRNISYGVDLTDKPRSKFLDAIGRISDWKAPKKKKR